MADTALSPMVLLVPPVLAAAWERLAPAQQAYWTRLLVHGWLRYILAPAPPPPGSEALPEISQMSLPDLHAFVSELERQFRLQAGEETP